MTKKRRFVWWARRRGSEGFTVQEAIEFFAGLGSKRLEQSLVEDMIRAHSGFRLVCRGPRGGVYTKRARFKALELPDAV